MLSKRTIFVLTYAYILVAHALFLTCFAVVATELMWGLWTWGDLLVLVVSFHCVGISVTVFYHRYFTHRAFRFTRLGKWTFRPLLACVSMTALQGPPRIWAAQHEHHHRKTDVPGDDPHGPVRNLLELVYVQFALYSPRTPTHVDVKAYEQRHRSRYDWFEWYVCSGLGYALLGIIIPISVAIYFGVGVWFVAGVGAVFHSVGAVNSLGHSAELLPRKPAWMRSILNVFAQQSSKHRYCGHTLNARPWISWLGGYLTGGEINHNQHHLHANSARIGVKWYDFDLGWWLICLLERAGMVTRVRRPSRSTLVVGETTHSEVLN